jgi:hypothetical protein
MNKLYIGIAVLVIGVGSAFYYAKPMTPKIKDSRPGAVFILKTDVDTKNDIIVVEKPLSDETISSPFTIEGEARGNWFFEASFPIELRDLDGNVLKTVVAQAQGDWMTTEFVPFTAKLVFAKPTSPMSAVLVFKKDNPSGLPEHDDSIEIPVTIQ